MIDVTNETMIRLEDVRDHLPSSRKGKRLSKAIVFRWASRGANGAVLETVKVGGGRFTTREALHRFVEAQNTREPNAVATSNTRSRSAGDILAKMGV